MTETPQRELPFADMGALVLRLRDHLEGRAATVWELSEPDREAFAARTGFCARGEGRPEVVLTADTAVELGHPRTASQSFVLRTRKRDLVRHRAVTLVGDDLGALDSQAPLGQVVLLGLGDGAAPDPFDVENLGLLTNRLPGWMVRSVPGRLWIRVSRDAVARGMDLRTVAEALVLAFSELPEVEAVEVLFVTASAGDVDALAPIEVEARIFSGRHKKLVLGAGGDVECPDLSCETCDEKPVCDELRDVVVSRRRAP